jgi:hypothetical protein
MKTNAQTQPDAFAWGNMSKAQKLLVAGSILFLVAVMGKSCIDAPAKSFDYSQCTSSAIAAGVYYGSGGSIDNERELDAAANWAASKVKECEEHGWN